MRKRIMILAMILVLCGCSNDAKEQTAVVFEDAATFSEEAVEAFPPLEIEDEAVQRSYEELYTDFGKFYSAQTIEGNGGYLLSLSDYEAGISYPLCPIPNCHHDSADCGAYFPFEEGNPDYLHYDGTDLYFYHRGESVMYRQRIDGSGRTAVADLSEDVFAVNAILYDQEQAWLLCELMSMNEETAKPVIRKTVVKLDLTTGTWTELPCIFEGDMANVELYGKYRDELLLRYNYSVGAVPWKNMEDSRSILFLMDVNTGAVTRLTEYAFNYVSSAKCPGYLIYCIFDPDSEYEVRYRGEAWSAFSGQIQIFDLNERVCYILESDCLTWEFSIRDGKLFYCELGEDGQTLEGRIRELDSGETSDWVFFDAEPQIRWLAESETGNEFIVICEDQICRIAKEEYYAGNRNLIPIP